MVYLAHNHILDTGVEGAIDTVGFHKEDRNKEAIVIKEVNGIKIATIAYTYGFNGLDSGLTAEQKEKHLSDLNQKK